MVAMATITAIGVIAFIVELIIAPQRAWQAYLVNFLVFSMIAQGGLLFSTLMHLVGARWSGPLATIAEGFAAFFPVSFVLFLLLPIGATHVFPWLHHDLHGKETWLNVPFLMARNGLGLLILYGLGAAYLLQGMRQKRLAPDQTERYKHLHQLKTRFSILYMLAFTIVLSLIGYDLVMAADPHWYSTLFGAYTFVKAIYVGLGALIILATVLHLNPSLSFQIADNQFHDIGKLFFAFCLVWADFFYCQFVVIWYGNISEETAYVIERTMHAPWKGLAWTVFTVSFIAPFLILLNKRIKTRPGAMSVLCAVTIMGIWLEHFLLLGPASHHGATKLPLGLADGLIALGFLGMMALALRFFFVAFPERLESVERGAG